MQLRYEQSERMQRLAQIVAGGGDETRFRLIGLLELPGALLDLAFQAGIGLAKASGHGVELIAERLELVASMDGDTLREIAAADSHRPVAQGANRNDHAARQQQAGEDGEHESDENDDGRANRRIVKRAVGFVERRISKDEQSRRSHLSVGAQDAPACNIYALQGLIRQAVQLCSTCCTHLSKS